MIRFELAKAHVRHRPYIRGILIRLEDRYPQAGLRRVSITPPRSDDDRSLAYASSDGEIFFNEHWFGRDPSFLNDAAHTDIEVEVTPGSVIHWHGGMVDEPIHVITHEFGHILHFSMQDKANDWATAGWRNATAVPTEAVTGYALANPLEYFAEAFAAVHLGKASQVLKDSFIRVLSE